MRRICDAGAYEAAAQARNHWPTTTASDAEFAPLETDADTDFAVIGAGFTGLNAALRLAERQQARVTVLDAKSPGWGASGRNGGFCCLGGSALDAKALARRFGPSDAQAFHSAERAAVDHVAGLIARFSIDADRHSDGETLLAHSPGAAANLMAEAEAIRARYGVEPRLLAREELAQAGMASPAFYGALTNPIGFALNPGKYVSGLARAATGAGVRIHGHSPVTAITRDSGGFRLTTPRATLRARKLLVATNGYSSEDIPDALAGRYLPVQSAIMVTRPITSAERAAQGWTSAQMAYDTRRLLHYFRLMPDNRFLFGMRGSLRNTPRALANAERIVRRDFEAMFPAWRGLETESFWSGLLCFSRDRTPFVGALPDLPGANAAFAFHGNGVAMGSYSGQLLADLAAGATDHPPIPAVMQSPPARFPLGRYRRAVLPPLYWLNQLLDARP